MALTDDDKHWINEQLERVETNLLTAFHRWASPHDKRTGRSVPVVREPMEMRQRTHNAAIRALDEEMENLQDRVKKLES